MVILRLSVITIFMLFGTYKWFDFEVMALEPIISSTWLNILYILFGVHGELLPRRNGNAYLSGTDYRFLQTCCRRAGGYHRYRHRYHHTEFAATTGEN